MSGQDLKAQKNTAKDDIVAFSLIDIIKEAKNDKGEVNETQEYSGLADRPVGHKAYVTEHDTASERRNRIELEIPQEDVHEQTCHEEVQDNEELEWLKADAFIVPENEYPDYAQWIEYTCLNFPDKAVA